MRSLEPPLLIIIVQNMRNENVPQRQYLLELRLTKAVCSHEKIVSVPGLTTFLMIPIGYIITLNSISKDLRLKSKFEICLFLIANFCPLQSPVDQKGIVTYITRILVRIDIFLSNLVLLS